MKTIYCISCHRQTYLKPGDIPVCKRCLTKAEEYDRGITTNTNELILELEERIPGVFWGPTCPTPKDIYVHRSGSVGSSYRTLGLKCQCTYKTGCMALKRIKSK